MTAMVRPIRINHFNFRNGRISVLALEEKEISEGQAKRKGQKSGKKWLLIFVCAIVVVVAPTIIPKMIKDMKREKIVDSDPTLFSYVEIDGGLEITGYDNKNTENSLRLVIPAEIDGKKVISIGEEAFRTKGGNMVEVIVPDGVTKICKYAFSITAIKSVTLPDTLECIEHGAFDGTELTEVDIPDSVKMMSRYSFNISLAEEVDGVMYIDNWVVGLSNELWDANSLDIVIRDDTVGICDSAFDNCKAIENVKIPASLRFIGERAFENCDNLESVKFLTASSLDFVGIRLESIGERAFANCRLLKGFSIPNDRINIAEDAFVGCVGMQ